MWEGQTSKETWCDFVSVVRAGSQVGHPLLAGAAGAKWLQPQLWWCECDCQSGSWRVGQESFLNQSTKQGILHLLCHRYCFTTYMHRETYWSA